MSTEETNQENKSQDLDPKNDDQQVKKESAEENDKEGEAPKKEIIKVKMTKKISYKDIKEGRKVKSFPVDQILKTPHPVMPVFRERYETETNNGYTTNGSLLPSRSAKTSILMTEALKPNKTPGRRLILSGHPLFHKVS